MANRHCLTTDQIRKKTDVDHVRTLPAGQRKRRRNMRIGSQDRTLVDSNALGFSQVLSAQVAANARNTVGRPAVVAR